MNRKKNPQERMSQLLFRVNQKELKSVNRLAKGYTTRNAWFRSTVNALSKETKK